MASLDSKMNSLLQEGRSRGLTEEEIREVLHFVIKQESEDKCEVASNQYCNSSNQELFWKIRNLFFSIARVAVTLLLITVAVGVVICLHNPTRKLLSRNVQDYIYPFMTGWRFVTFPFLYKWPQLSSWYEEECIVQNVFFDNLNVNCEACVGVEDVAFIAKMENFTETFYNGGKPFILDLGAKYPNLDQLHTIVSNNHELFTTGSYFKTAPVSVRELFSSRECISSLSKDVHIEWQVFRMTTVQMFRTYFPRLEFIPPDTEVALRRYIFIDGKESVDYNLPITEFSNVIVAQIEGSSSIILEPSSTCRISSCAPMKVNLQHGQILYYNWLYWRPVRSSCVADVNVENENVDSKVNMEQKNNYADSSTAEESTTNMKDEIGNEVDVEDLTENKRVYEEGRSKIVFGKECTDEEISLVYISSFY